MLEFDSDPRLQAQKKPGAWPGFDLLRLTHHFRRVMPSILSTYFS